MGLSRIVRFFTFAALSLALSACGTFDDPIDDDTIATNAPPYGEFEAPPLIQNPQTEIWRPGYWSYVSGDGFEWIPGKIITRPTPTAVWTSARWVHHTYGWSFEQGHWN